MELDRGVHGKSTVSDRRRSNKTKAYDSAFLAPAQLDMRKHVAREGDAKRIVGPRIAQEMFTRIVEMAGLESVTVVYKTKKPDPEDSTKTKPTSETQNMLPIHNQCDAGRVSSAVLEMARILTPPPDGSDEVTKAEWKAAREAWIGVKTRKRKKVSREQTT